MWNRCARRVLGLPAQTHTASSLENRPLQCTNLQKDNKACAHNAKSQNETVKYLANNGLNSMKSIIGHL